MATRRKYKFGHYLQCRARDSNSESLLLPRFVDNQNRTDVEFESWLCGVGDLLAFRRMSRQKYEPHD